MLKEPLAKLIERAKTVSVSAEDRENQRKSFAFGNSAFENPRITREMVEEQAMILKRENG